MNLFAGQKEMNTVYECIYMEFRKMVPMDDCTCRAAKETQRKKQTFELSGKRRGWDDLRE